jgi:hypothetical protein
LFRPVATHVAGPRPVNRHVAGPVGGTVTVDATATTRRRADSNCPFPHGNRREPSSLQIGSQVHKECFHAPPGLDGVGGLAVHPGRAAPTVTPHPTPRLCENIGVIDKVVEVIEPTTRIVGRPTMQLGLNMQYPEIRHEPSRLVIPVFQFTGVHQRLLLWQSQDCGSAALLRRVHGFPVLGLLRGLRPTTEPCTDGVCSRSRPGWPTGRETRSWFPRSLSTVRRDRRPALPLWPRHGYAADLHRGLPVSAEIPT